RLHLRAGQVVQVVIGGRLAGVQAPLDPVQSGGEDGGSGQVGIAGAVNGAVLDSTGGWDAEHLGAVVGAVADVNGGPGGAALRAAPWALVGVGRGRVSRDGGRGVGLQTADEVVCGRRQPEPVGVAAVLVGEDTAPVLPEAHVKVTAVAGEVREGLRHEGGDQA